MSLDPVQSFSMKILMAKGIDILRLIQAYFLTGIVLYTSCEVFILTCIIFILDVPSLRPHQATFQGGATPPCI